ncbi:lipoyl(octanoyl) transferase LipB, partial [Ligilactobacillus salivarius]
AYILVDVRRAGCGVRDLVTAIENSLIDVLGQYGVAAQAKPDAPGVYVADKKIASLGLRIRRGCSFHGLALNVDMDLQPFQRINPCGYAGLQMTQLRNETQQTVDLSAVSVRLRDALVSQLNYSEYITLTDGIECYE